MQLIISFLKLMKAQDIKIRAEDLSNMTRKKQKVRHTDFDKANKKTYHSSRKDREKKSMGVGLLGGFGFSRERRAARTCAVNKGGVGT